jgi:Stage II sporulation protein M
MQYPMKADGLAVVQGWPETAATLRRWRRAPGTRPLEWTLGSLAVAVALLAATWYVAILSPVDPSPYPFPGLTRPAYFSDFLFVVYRNSLVLALHAAACVAGFIAGSPRYLSPGRGMSARVHRHAGRGAIAFVAAATLFSLGTQALALGSGARDLSAHLGVSPLVLLLTLTPHALPELFALFLPLAAWILAGRRGAWNELLAATLVTTACAVPLLVGAAAIETWVTPGLLHGLAL